MGPTELMKLLRRGGAIVSSAKLSAADIVVARACDHMHVDDDGFGYVYVREGSPAADMILPGEQTHHDPGDGTHG